MGWVTLKNRKEIINKAELVYAVFKFCSLLQYFYRHKFMKPAIVWVPLKLNYVFANFGLYNGFTVVMSLDIEKRVLATCVLLVEFSIQDWSKALIADALNLHNGSSLWSDGIRRDSRMSDWPVLALPELRTKHSISEPNSTTYILRTFFLETSPAELNIFCHLFFLPCLRPATTVTIWGI